MANLNGKHEESVTKAIAKIDSIHEQINDNIQHLNQLPIIAETNKEIAASFKMLAEKFNTLENTTLAAALGKSHLPLPVVLIIIITLSTIIILQSVQQKTLKLSPTQLEISSDTRH